MYLSKDREQAPKSSKKLIIAAATGLAVAGVATVSYMNQEDSMDFETLASASRLGDSFFNNIDFECNHWYTGASNTFLMG